MRGKNKSRQRSTAIQRGDLHNSETDTGLLTTRLCKKAGFRNLLQREVTVSSEANDRGHERVSSANGRMSRSVQATASTEGDLGKIRFPHTAGESLELCGSVGGRGITTDVAKVFERTTGAGANPGTSRMPSTAISNLSYVSQLNAAYRRTHDGSLAVLYNPGDKTVPRTVSSNLLYFGSQGSRRFSDETVLLIEDYHSYDTANAAGRQEVDRSRRRPIGLCCARRKQPPPDPLTRPVPLSVDKVDEDDESVVCRICHEGERVHPLLQPCLCKGSVGCVHAHCLKTWLEQSNTSRCELCNYPYAVKQTKKYSTCVSIRVFFGTVVNKKSLLYDAISFVVITPLTIVGVVMCIQASVSSTASDITDTSNFQMGNITRAGMIMLSVTILVAYCVWLYTLTSFHYKAWKKWYDNCYDVEVLPIRMTSEEKLEAARMLNQELSRRQLSRERGSTVVAVIQSPHSTNYALYQARQVSVSENAS